MLQVAQQCKENIYAIQTLKDFQYLDENKDQGINVREKAKAVVALLKDDDRLKNERVRALKAKERFAQAAAGIGSDTVVSQAAAASTDNTTAVSYSRPDTVPLFLKEYNSQPSPAALLLAALLATLTSRRPFHSTL